MQQMVSVLIPVYNHQRFVISCLESVRNEGWGNIELVIHDDRSLDNSWDLVTAWCEDNRHSFSNIVIEQAAENRGVVGSLNRLIEMASGDYILSPLASDDRLLPGGIKKRFDALEARSDWLAVFADAETINDDGKKLSDSCLFEHFRSKRKYLLADETRRMEMIIRWSVPGPVILYRKEAFDPQNGVGNYSEDYCIEDRDMYLRLLTQKQLGFVDDTVAQYRLHDSNTISSPAFAVRNIVDRAHTLLEFSKDKSLSSVERFVARHTALALAAHAKRRSTSSSAIRAAYTLVRIYHILLARPTGELYLRTL